MSFDKLQIDQYQVIQSGIQVVLAVLVFLLGRWLARRTRTALHVTLGKTALAPSLVRLLDLAAYYGILYLTVIVSLALVGFPVAPVIAVSLIVVIILGIALQQSISNLAATVVFMLFQPFRVGELIEANAVLGVAKELQLLSTVLVTGDNREITIPNGEIQRHNLINYTRLGRLRVDFEFGVSYGDDLGQVKRVLAELLAADARILADPEPAIFVKSLDDSCVTLAVRPWVKPDDYWRLQSELPERVKLCFDAEGISIPFPQRDVHISNGSGPAAVQA